MAPQRSPPKHVKSRGSGSPTGPKRKASASGPSRRKKSAKSRAAPEASPREKPPARPEQRPAFFADARHATDALAEELGEGFVLNVTSGEDTEEYYEREREEEEGGPFLETSARTEFAYGVDESNPEDAEPAPWPAVSPGQPPPHRSGGPR
jgi:hypothetical protein